MSNEKNPSFLIKESKRNNNRTNLILKFRKVFTLPICLGILINVAVTIYLLFYFCNSLKNQTELLKIIKNSENEGNLPIIKNVGNILFKKFQPSIYSLISIKKYIIQIASKDFLNLNFNKSESEQLSKMKKFINKYSKNIHKFYLNYTNIYNEIKENILDYSVWFLDDKKDSLDQLTEDQVKRIYLVVNLNLLFRSQYELYNYSNYTGFTKIYGGFAQSNLYFSYPPFNSSNINDTNYEGFFNFVNPTDCRDNDLKIPNYFYFKCRPWFRETVALNKKNNFTITITYPYSFVSNKNLSGITACAKIDDAEIFGDLSPNKNEYLIICIDMPLSDIRNIFDYMNNLIYGYFFVLRINSDIPIYYPQIKGEITSLVRNEFDNESEYYTDELIEFKDNATAILNKQIDFNTFDSSEEEISKILIKNGTNYSYKIFPITLNFEEEAWTQNKTSKGINMMNVIHVSDNNSFDKTLYNLNKTIEIKIIFSSVIILILGSIVLLITFYLINSIATNILRPIKMMNGILVDMNKKKEDNEGEILKENKKSILKINKQKYFEEDNDLYDDDDDLFDIRSSDIDSLFCTLIDLKKTLYFVQGDRYQDSENKMLNLLFAKNTFKSINNTSASYLCNSNLGNLSIKFKKYDKAIIHLFESVKLNKNPLNLEDEEFLSLINNNLINDELNNYQVHNICEDKNFDKILGNKNSKNPKKKNNLRPLIEMELEKKINLESRIPKLIFAYKKYFKNINRYVKILTYNNSHNNSEFLNFLGNMNININPRNKYITDEEFYYINRDKLITNFLNKDIISKSNYHSLINFKVVIDQYKHQADESNNIRLKILSEFEYLEFLIKYFLKPLTFNHEYLLRLNSTEEKNNSENNLENLLNINESKLNNLKTHIKDCFVKADGLIKDDSKDTSERFLISKKLTKKLYLEYSDIPKCVLLQRYNFLYAKFSIENDIKDSLVKFNSITSLNDDVIDGIILMSSLKKMKNIFYKIIKKLEYIKTKDEYYYDYQRNLEGNDNRKNKDPSIQQNYKKAAENYLNEFIDKSNLCINAYEIEINKFSIVHKDIAIILDYSHNILQEPKKKEKGNKFFEYIFENICTFNDRISLFGYHKNSFQLLSLMFKNNRTIKLIENHYKDIFKNEEFFGKNMEESELVKAICYVYNNIGKKDIYNKREKWIIVLTDEISENDLKNFQNNFSKNIYGQKKNENLVVIKFKFSVNENEKIIMDKALKFNKSCFIELENKNELKSKMRIHGNINENGIFDNEVYNP